jgi:hypothetical protein
MAMRRLKKGLEHQKTLSISSSGLKANARRRAGNKSKEIKAGTTPGINCKFHGLPIWLTTNQNTAKP